MLQPRNGQAIASQPASGAEPSPHISGSARWNGAHAASIATATAAARTAVSANGPLSSKRVTMNPISSTCVEPDKAASARNDSARIPHASAPSRRLVSA